MGGLAPANTLVPPRVIAREPISRLIISGRQREEVTLDLIVDFESWETVSMQKARSVPLFGARRNPCRGNCIAIR